MSTKSCSGAGKEGKRKKAVEDQEVDKVVGDKVVCERWCVCVTKKDGVCVKDVVCVKVVCEREHVTKMVCERWCVTKWCVKDGVAKDGV